MSATKVWTAASMGSQAGKTVLITGANSGIGYQAAVELARHGAHVLLGCRSLPRAEAALARLKAEAQGAQGAQAEIVLLDMASLSSIRSFAGAYVGAGQSLDVLINNAGVMALPQRELTDDGFERQFGTNHLGHFALTGLLMPALLQADAPRVVTVSSLAHRNGRMEWNNLQSERKYTPWDAYNASKLANLLFALELQRRATAAGSRLQSNAVHPGISQTGLFEAGRDLKTRMVKLLGPLLLQSDAMGALPTLYAATSPEVRGGEYIGPGGPMEFRGHPKVVEPRANALNEQDAQELWQVSEQLTGVVFPPLR